MRYSGSAQLFMYSFPNVAELLPIILISGFLSFIVQSLFPFTQFLLSSL